jgi:hypothetical protein
MKKVIANRIRNNIITTTTRFMDTTSPKTFSGPSTLILALFLCGALCVIASVVIPLSHYRGEYSASQDRQRAREIASVCNAAQAAGFDPVDYSGLETTIRNVVRGGRINERLFFVPGMTESDIPRVAKHLRLVGGKLVFSPAGATVPVVATSQN